MQLFYNIPFPFSSSEMFTIINATQLRYLKRLVLMYRANVQFFLLQKDRAIGGQLTRETNYSKRFVHDWNNTLQAWKKCPGMVIWKAKLKPDCTRVALIWIIYRYSYSAHKIRLSFGQKQSVTVETLGR